MDDAGVILRTVVALDDVEPNVLVGVDQAGVSAPVSSWGWDSRNSSMWA